MALPYRSIFEALVDFVEHSKELYRSWASEYKNVRGLEEIATLYMVNSQDLNRDCVLITL
jgi:hypothetical protein